MARVRCRNVEASIGGDDVLESDEDRRGIGKVLEDVVEKHGVERPLEVGEQVLDPPCLDLVEHIRGLPGGFGMDLDPRDPGRTGCPEPARRPTLAASEIEDAPER